MEVAKVNRVFILTLGCSKNDVDSECMAKILGDKKYILVDDIEKADYVIINTCAFIQAAKEESVDAILSVVKEKEKQNFKIIVSGCLAQRYYKELSLEIPEIDIIIGTGNIYNIADILENNKDRIFVDNINSDFKEIKRDVSGPVEYVKIAEGCNNACSYCIIPKLRGRLRSRSIEDIVNEIDYLHENGVKEVILIAQNTTDYGVDIYKKPSLKKLLQEIIDKTKIERIRVLYLYPDSIDDELIDIFRREDRIMKYMDIPLQHISSKILKKMNRNMTKEYIYDVINNIRNKISEIIIRTTFIVGFPYENKDDFEELVSFIKEMKFDKLGVFTYSNEEETQSFNMAEQVDEDKKEERRNIIMQEQLLISEKKLSEKISKVYKVLIEEKETDNLYTGRSYMDAPDIDGVVYIETSRNLSIGDIVDVKIVDSSEYDLYGELV